MSKKEQIDQIQELIALGKTEDALYLLKGLTSDAILLLGTLRDAGRLYQMNLTSLSDWNRVQAKINYEALEMLNSVVRDMEKEQIMRPNEENSRGEVFLAYNEKDKTIAQRIRQYLEDTGMRSQPNFWNFWKKSYPPNMEYHIGEISAFNLGSFILKKASLSDQFFLPIISLNSLREGWKGLEHHVDILSNSLTYHNTFPLALDKIWLEPDFIQREVEKIDKQLDEIDAQIRSKKEDSARLEDLAAKLTFQRNNLPKIVQRLKNARVIDLSEGHFEQGMSHVANTIANALQRLEPAGH